MQPLRSLYQGELPALVLFDLDGTLADSAPDLADAVDTMLAAAGLRSAGEARVRQWVGNGARMLVHRALAWSQNLADLQQLEPAHLEQAHQAFLAAYRAGFCCRTVLYPGVRDCLTALTSARIPLAVVTNKPQEFVAPLLEHLHIAHFFGLGLGGDALAAKKPDPLPLRHACDHFGVVPAQALMVGDSRNDVAAARACGMPVVALSYGYNHGEPIEATRPDRVIDSLTALL